jgi:peptidyl-prolyl cis-trans isomerase D
MMRTLREKTGIILWFVIFAFVGLIVVEWGADYSGGGGERAGDAVGVINGEKVDLKQFQQILRNTARQQPDDQPVDQGALVREIWGETVSTILVRQQIEKLGITVSDKEIALVTRSQPPPVVQGLEVFQTEGEFDPAKYSQFLNDPTTFTNARNKTFVMQLEAQVRQQWLNYKLQRLLTETVQVSPPEIRHYFETQNQKIDAEYLFVPASTTSDDDVQVGDGEIQARYEETQEAYTHPDQIRMSFVVFPKVPNTKDSLDVFEEITNIRGEIEAGADFEELARAVSEDQGTAENGGDLGTFGRGRMVAPFEEVAFALEPGQVSDPVITPFGWHLIKVEERLDEDGKEEVRARHILLRLKASRQTQEEIFSWAEEFRDRAGRESFDAAVRAAGMQPNDSGFLAKDSSVPRLGVGTSWMVNLFHDSEIGTVSNVLEQDDYFWIAHLTDLRAKGVTPLAEVRDAIARKLSNEKKSEMAGQRLGAIRLQIGQGATFESAAAAAALEVRSTGAFARMESVPGVGQGNAFVGAAFRLNAGDVSEVVMMPRGAYLIRVVEKTPVDEAAFDENREELTEKLLGQRQTEALQTWYAQMYATATIEDNRHFFFAF